MIKKRKFPKIFPGWWLVLSTGILAMMQNAYYVWGLSALFKPISTELGFSRAATSVGTSIGRFEGGIEGPVVGWATDKYGPRWLVLTGVFFFGLSLILMYFINSLWAYYLIWGGMLGLAFNMSSAVPVRTAISNWFVKKRGLAQSIQTQFAGLSAVLGLPIIAWLIVTQGWRVACLAGGIVTWLVGLPLVWFFVKQHRPEYYGLLPDGAAVEAEAGVDKAIVERGAKYAGEVEEVEFTLKQALRTPAFWLMSVVRTASAMASSAITLHAIPFLTDMGFDPLLAAGMVSLRVLVSLPGRLMGGVLADRVRKNQMRFVMGGGYLLQAVGTAVFLLHPTVTMIYVWYIIYGLGWGMDIGVQNPIQGRYFGRKAIGVIMGLGTALGAPAGIIAPIYFGWVYDTVGNYMTAFTLVVITVGFSGIMAFLVLPPKPPAVVNETKV